MLLDMLTMDGIDVLNNKMGSNINSGIASSLIYGSSLSGKCRYKVGVFEVDERSALRVFPYMKPEYLLITNLSRDSIMILAPEASQTRFASSSSIYPKF